ncbi:MAG: hypothetical protein KAT70_01435, partial [Thermoplasmata archaeon]|nr:hypothetical protein [Thermoplasmata archaeon]
MRYSIIRFAAIMVCFGFLLHTFGAFVVSNGETGGNTHVSTDMELLGVSSLGGGGHINWKITGEAAEELRAKAIMRFDTNRNGILDAEEIYPGAGSASSAEMGYVSAVEFYVERSDEYVGAQIYGAKPLSRDEGSDGWIKDVTGLLDEEAGSSSPIEIRFLFDSKKAQTQGETLSLVPNLMGEAAYAPFPDGSFATEERLNFAPRDLTRAANSWHQASGGN